MADTDALTERIAEALFEKDEPGITWDETLDFPTVRRQYMDDAGAVLPIVAEEVREAKAEALREAAVDIDFDLGRGYTGADDRDATAAAEVWLRDRAEQIKKEDPR